MLTKEFDSLRTIDVINGDGEIDKETYPEPGALLKLGAQFTKDQSQKLSGFANCANLVQNNAELNCWTYDAATNSCKIKDSDACLKLECNTTKMTGFISVGKSSE